MSDPGDEQDELQQRRAAALKASQEGVKKMEERWISLNEAIARSTAQYEKEKREEEEKKMAGVPRRESLEETQPPHFLDQPTITTRVWDGMRWVEDVRPYRTSDEKITYTAKSEEDKEGRTSFTPRLLYTNGAEFSVEVNLVHEEKSFEVDGEEIGIHLTFNNREIGQGQEAHNLLTLSINLDNVQDEWSLESNKYLVYFVAVKEKGK